MLQESSSSRLPARSVPLAAEVQHVVENARVAGVEVGNRKQFFQLVAKQLRFQLTLAGGHPIHISAQCIYFAVVAHKAHRLSTFPGGKCIRAEREWTMAKWLV